MLPGAENQAQILVRALKHPRFWSQIHAAEYLIELQLAPAAVQDFLQRQQALEQVPIQRIGIWRVKALQARQYQDQAGYDKLIAQLKAAAFAPETPGDRIHAVETLFKLQYKCSAVEQKLLRKFISRSDSPAALQIYAAALLGLVDDQAFFKLNELLEQHQNHKVYSSVLLYVLGQYRELPPELLAQLQKLRYKFPKAEHRTTAAVILLAHRQLVWEKADVKLHENHRESLLAAYKFVGDRKVYRKLLQQMQNSEDIEAKMFAEYFILKNLKE